MGGTFKKMLFSDIDCDYPSRRKLTKISGQENVYDVQREVGQIRTPGTSWNAKTMNDFQNNIDDMFPVSVINGGTGANNQQEARDNLGLAITKGSFADSNFGVYSTTNFNRRININTANNPTILAKYYRIADLVIANIYIHHLIATEYINNQGAYLAIGPLPFLNSSGIDVSATISEFAIYPSDRTTKASGYVKNNDRFILIYKDDGGLAYPVSSWTNLNQKNTLDATLSITYSLS